MAETVELVSEVSPDLTDIRQMETSVVGEVPLSEDMKAELRTLLDDELFRAEGDRQAFIDKLARWQLVYEAPMPDEPKDFPLANSSNITVPVTKESVNALTAQLAQTTITPSPRWVLKTDSEGWMPFIGTLERFLDRASKEEFELDNVIETWILEAAKYGTSVIEAGYEEKEVNFHIYSRDGKKAEKKKKTKRGPVVYNVPLQDFLIPFESQDIQEAFWVAKRIRMNDSQLKQRQQSGKFKDVSNIVLARPDDSPAWDLEVDTVVEVREAVEETEPSLRRNHLIYEVWLRYDIDGDGIDEDLLIYYHRSTRTLLSVRYNPYWHHKRPFIAVKFFPVEYRFYGQGLCDQLEALQEEISTVHNQRIDNATIANLRMLKVRRGSDSLKQGDPLFTGQIVEVDEMDDVDGFQLGEIYPSTIANENIAREYVERLSGVSDAQMGRAQPVSRTTATAQLALLQESAKRFDLTIRKIRTGMGELGEFIFMYYFQFGIPKGRAVQWLGPRGRAVDAIFSLPYSAIELGLGFEAGAPSSQLNKEAQKQNYLSVFQLMVQMYGQILELAGPLVGPQGMAPVAGSLVRSAKEFMFQVLERFDVTNPEEALSGLAVLEKLLPAPEDLGGLEDFEKRRQEAQILEQVGGLERLLTENTGGDREGEELTYP